MQTPTKTASNSASSKSAFVNQTGDKPAEQKKFNDDDDFDEDFDDASLDDLDYDATRFDDDEDDY